MGEEKKDLGEKPYLLSGVTVGSKESKDLGQDNLKKGRKSRDLLKFRGKWRDQANYPKMAGILRMELKTEKTTSDKANGGRWGEAEK